MLDQYHRGFFFILMAAFLLVTVGCSEDEKSIGSPGPGSVSDLPFPASPDIVMQNFRTIYESRDHKEFQLILAAGFETILQDGTIVDFPNVGETLDVAEELRINKRMFSGDAVTDPNGDFIPGITAVFFSRFSPLGPWAESLPTDPIPDSQWALYDVEILLDRGQTYSTLRVIGSIKFHVTSRDSLHEGTMQQYHQMIGQVDLTGGWKAVERELWGSVKALFH